MSGYVSMVTSVLSLFFMMLTLVTYFLFDELRNLPGWNILNLTLALLLGQFSFFIGSFSFIKHIPWLCFLIAILTHYGFLVAFFCTNVIAFDLFRNFRKNSRHILLKNVFVKSRLPKYATYAWLGPLLIVLVALTIDLSLQNKNAQIRPCYSGYLSGCNIFQSARDELAQRVQSLNNKVSKMLLNATKNEKISTLCFKPEDVYSEVLVFRGDCWLQSGFSNLIFFGQPIALIIIANLVFFSITIFNVRKASKDLVKKNNFQIRRFSLAKLPTDNEAKFFIAIGAILGFTWIIGFVLMTFPDDPDRDSENIQNVDIVYLVFTYMFILLNSSTGVFKFFMFIFRRNVLNMYVKKWKELCLKFEFRGGKRQEKVSNSSSSALGNAKTQSRSRGDSQSSSVGFVRSISRKISFSSSTSVSTPMTPSKSLIVPSSMFYSGKSELLDSKNTTLETVTQTGSIDEVNDNDEPIYI